MLDAERFYALVRENGGFEVTLGYRGDVDCIIGGTGNKIWYCIKKGSSLDWYLGTRTGDERTDTRFTLKRKVLSSVPAPAGKTEALILGVLSTGQKEIEESGHKPVKTALYDHPCSHYSFRWGERAYKVSDEYGITVEYSDIKNEAAGFRLRNIETGAKVRPPRES